MTRRNIDKLVAQTNSPPIEAESDGMMSPPAPQASPADRSPGNANGAVRQDAPSPPTMLATMTPVNVLELKKELDDKRDDQTAVYHVKTEMIYSPDKEENDIYTHGIGNKHQHHAPIDLIYEDGNKTVIYTTTPDQKGLEIYSSQTGGDVTINNINAHAHLSEVLMNGSDDSDVGGTSAGMNAGAADAISSPPGAVSVVLQTGGQGLLQYPQSQVPGTTVLVLSELVEDMSTVPVLGLRKRKNSLEPPTVDHGGETQASGGGGGVSPLQGHGAVRMADLSSDQQHHQHQQHQTGSDQEQHTWRAYYEHPLTAATTAMLNISGGGADDQAATMGFIYEYYKLPPLAPDSATKDKLADIWPSSSHSSGILTSQLKAANGLVSGAGLEIAAPPLGTALGGQLGSQPDIGLFINQHVGYVQPTAGGGVGQNLQIVKREPEDLSHHRKLESGSPGIDNSIIFGGKQQRPKVVLVSSANGHPNDLVVDVNSPHTVIKDESRIHRGLNSPQHGSRSINGTPTSTHSSLLADGSNAGPIELISAADGGLKPAMYTAQIFSTHGSASESPSPIPYSDHATQYTQSALSGTMASGSYITGGSSSGDSGTQRVGTGSVAAAFTVADPYYREYFTTVTSGAGTPEPVYTTQLRQNQIGGYTDSTESSGAAATASFVERYVRQSSAYHSKGVIAAAGLTVDLPSPDSGIGADAITPRDQNALQQTFDYTELCQANSGLLDPATLAAQRATNTGTSPNSGVSGRSRPWHDFGRQNDADKIQIPKLYSSVGFKYHLETPISTSQRREDDRITYINKGQFYGITLEYIPDPDKPLKNQTVKSVVMLMFREEKSPEDEIKAWQFWHGRQHSVKQRILDADTKNSVGLVGCIEEVAHNAIAVYWNPLDSSAKINVAVQCLSTDFSSQKGVKGLPLHLQIDTYEEPRDTTVSHRGYCQIKVFCDKGAERKTRDEERRAAKRKMTATGRKKLDELYHPVSERSEFYSMSDLAKPPVLFTPAEDIDKLTSMELQGFYNHETDSSLSGGGGTGGPTPEVGQHLKSGSPFLLHAAVKTPTTPTLKFHNHFPPDADKKDGILEANVVTTDGSMFTPPSKRPKLMSGPGGAGPPPLNERVMLYVRQESEEVYTPLHVVPPTTVGLLNAIESKYKIDSSRVNNLFRKNRKGILAKIDDEMVTYYCNEDLFLLEVKAVGIEEDLYDITFIELPNH